MNQKFQALNEEIATLKETISTLRNSSVSAGTICAFAGPTIDVHTMSNFAPPNGYEWCLGQIVSKTDEKYAALYAAIGGYWNTSTELTDDQFQLPDLRNVFLRGCTDYVEGSSNNRVLGTFQACGAPNSTGRVYSRCQTSILGNVSGAFVMDETTKNSYAGYSSGSGPYIADFNLSRSSSVYQDGLTELRPDNKAVNYIIKL